MTDNWYRQLGISGDVDVIWRELMRNPPKDICTFTTLSHKDYFQRNPALVKKGKRVAIPKWLRIKLVSERGGLCEVCGADEYDEVHHVDGDPSNDDEKNLLLVCMDCHKEAHSSR